MSESQTIDEYKTLEPVHKNVENKIAERASEAEDEYEPEQKNKWFNIYMTIIMSSGGVYFGYYIAIFNPMAEPLLNSVYDIKKTSQDEVKGNFNFFFAMGALFSVMVSGWLSDNVGRMRMLLIAELLALITFVGYTIENINILYCVRVLSGIIAGFNTAIAQLALKEILPKKLIPFGGMVIYICSVSAILVVYSLSYIYDKQGLSEHWRFILLIPVPITVIRAASFCFFNIESPKYYFVRYKKFVAKEKSAVILQKIYQRHETARILEEIEACFEEEMSSKPTFSSLFKKQYRQRLVAALIVNLGQQFSGINYLIFYSTSIFNEVSGNGKQITFIMGIVKTFTGMIGTWAIQKFGRKPLLTFGALGQGISFFVLFAFLQLDLKHWIFLPVSTYLIGFALGLGATTLIYTVDILPPNGVGLALGVQWISTSLVGKYTPIFGAK